MAYHYRRMEIEAEREQRGELFENRWEPLRCRVMVCEEERMTVRVLRVGQYKATALTQKVVVKKT